MYIYTCLTIFSISADKTKPYNHVEEYVFILEQGAVANTSLWNIYICRRKNTVVQTNFYYQITELCLHYHEH
jgi:hypothetical protein